jgi:selenocysteine lyase/cysteine desulfurase
VTAPLDVERLRAETPGSAHVLHFNNAGAALPPAPVVEAQLAHLRLEAEIGGYEAAARATTATERTYDALADLLGAQRDEIAVVENATRAYDMAFYAFPLEKGDRILTSAVEYASNYLAFLQVARRTGAVIEEIPSEADGTISIPALRASLRRGGAALVSLTHVPTNGGIVNPAAEVGRACQEAGVPFLLDACQSVGQMPTDVSALGCDMLSATARKFLRGPRGVGFLYVKRALLERLEPPFVDLHAAS